MYHLTAPVLIFTSTATYQWFLATWDANAPKVRELRLAAIKADIPMRSAAEQQTPDVESTQPLSLGDTSRYEVALTEELQDAIFAKRLTRRNIPDTGGTSADVAETTESIPNEPTIFEDERGSNTEEDTPWAHHRSKPARRPPLSKPANPGGHDIPIDPRLVDTNQHEPNAGRECAHEQGSVADFVQRRGAMVVLISC